MKKNIGIIALVLALALSTGGCKKIITLLFKAGDDAARHGDEAAEMIEKAVKNTDGETVTSAGEKIIEKAADVAGAVKDVTDEKNDD